MPLCWNGPRRWLVSICIVYSTFWTHSMWKLSLWIMHRLWRQIQAIITSGIFHRGVSSLFNMIVHNPFKTPKAIFTTIWPPPMGTRLYEVPICFALGNLSFSHPWMVNKTMASLSMLYLQSICMAKMQPSSFFCQCWIFGTMCNHGNNQPIQNHHPKTYILHQPHLLIKLNRTLSTIIKS